MGNNEAIWSCPQVVCNHPLANRYLSTLNNISEKDYPGKKYFKVKIEALDLDQYEIDNAKNRGHRDHSADAAIGICNGKRNNYPINPRFLLVELRMDYQKMNFHASEIKKKFKHSSEILREVTPDIKIDSKYCLIFNKNLYGKALYWLENKKREQSDLKTCVAFYPENFCNFINAGKSIPYAYAKQTTDLGNQLLECIKNNDLQKLDSYYVYTRKYIENCGVKFKLEECNYLEPIIAKITDYLDKLIPNNDDEELDIIILKQDYNQLRKLILKFLS